MLLYLQHTVSLCFHHYEPQALLQNLKILAKIETAQFYVSFPPCSNQNQFIPRNHSHEWTVFIPHIASWVVCGDGRNFSFKAVRNISPIHSKVNKCFG